MGPQRLSWRWLLAAAVAACLCAASIALAMRLNDSATLDEVFAGVAWLSAIATAFCCVRAGFDAGVHHSHRPGEVPGRYPTR